MNKEAENKMDKKDMMESLEEIRRQFDADMHREIDLQNQEREARDRVRLGNEARADEFYLKAQRVAPLFAESLRDKFAMAALTGLYAANIQESTYDADARNAYRAADAMMKQRSVDND